MEPDPVSPRFTHRALWVRRLATCGDTFAVMACPRMRFNVPSSHRLIGVSSRTLGHRNSTSPPPSGWNPRRLTLSAKPSMSTPKALRIGGSAVFSVSMDTSEGWLVTPVNRIRTGVFAKRHNGTMASRKYPMELRQQRCERGTGNNQPTDSPLSLCFVIHSQGQGRKAATSTTTK